MADLTTLANVESWLKLAPGNSDEPLLSRLIAAASDFVETFCGRPFLSAPVTDTRDGDGGQGLVLSVTPVTAVASVTIDGNAIPSGDSGSTPGFYFTATALFLNGYRFCRGRANIVIAYTAGFETAPPAIEQAVIELVGQKYKERDRIGLSSEAMAGETTAFFLRDMPASVATMLARYQKVVPV